MSGSIGNQRLLAHRHGVLCSSANAALAALQQVLDFHAGVLQLGSTRCLVDKLSSPSSCSAACNQSTSFARRHVQVSHHLPQRVKPSGAAAHAAAARGFIGRQLQQQHLHQPCHSWQECETQQQQQQQSAAWRHSSSKQTRLQAEWQHGSSLMPCSSKVPTEPQPVQHPLASSSHSSRSAILCNRSRFSTNSGLAINSWYPVRGFSSTAAPAAVAAMAQQASMLEELQKALEADESQALLTPGAVVERLNRVIVGQEEAKKAVAIAYRNRWRRQRVTDPEMREEISPKNLLLIGPTGCGKTEIARRLAKLAEAPFIKVEATKFTEVGYHGRDVDSIVRDLVEVALTTVKARCKRAAAKRIALAVEGHVLHAILGEGATLEAMNTAREKYRAGELEDAIIEVEVPTSRGQGDPGGLTIQGGQVSMSISLAGMFGGAGGGAKGREKRSMTVVEARPYLEEAEAERQFPAELLAKEAVRVAEQEGIVFIDEIDKIVNPSNMLRHGSDPSAEGVQRDLLPLIEGSVVSTKHGPVATDHMLFIASGAFTSAKPSDMMAELQGRLPIRVELKGLTAADFERILTEPECNMIYQQQRLLGCEGVDLEFTPEAIKEVAALAEQINTEVENIGARRLHTVLERLVEDISFEAPDKVAEVAAAAAGSEAAGATAANGVSAAAEVGGQELRYKHVIDKQDVQQKLADLLKQQDYSKFIL